MCVTPILQTCNRPSVKPHRRPSVVTAFSVIHAIFWEAPKILAGEI
jgi:hypothetical protein